MREKKIIRWSYFAISCYFFRWMKDQNSRVIVPYLEKLAIGATEEVLQESLTVKHGEIRDPEFIRCQG